MISGEKDGKRRTSLGYIRFTPEQPSKIRTLAARTTGKREARKEFGEVTRRIYLKELEISFAH